MCHPIAGSKVDRAPFAEPFQKLKEPRLGDAPAASCTMEEGPDMLGSFVVAFHPRNLS